MPTVVAIHIFISGRVQGVYFRSSMKNIADKLNIVGWVRNSDDGKVEAVVQGSAHDVTNIIDWCRHGPPSAEVNNVLTEEIAIQSNLQNFGILY